jgi:molybdopterin-dependent oxidoreductase alpha subunit
MADNTDGIKQYEGPAGGWGALKAVADAVREQMGANTNTRALMATNQPEGFDCPGCAWPDPQHKSSFDFCENGAKAVTWEATPKRATPEFFAQHTVSELWTWSDHDLENQGRLTHPLRYDASTDRFVPVSWEEAFDRAGEALRNLTDPNQAEFYTSGRASNEASFLFQLFGREFGTNNFPDCSNMCHEATSVGLPRAIGIGKGTVTLDDFTRADAVFCIGHNPGTNHPRMLATLRAVALRGKPIVVINPMRERGLERFQNPQSPVEMLSDTATPLASAYHQVRVGGDVAAIKGVMKALFEADQASLDAGGKGLLDRDFIAEHTSGFEALKADILAGDWDRIVKRSGLTREAIESIARTYWTAENVIICYGMGITQHRHGTEAIQQLTNLLLLRGNMGKPGAGICPLRGHSNVQGNRTVGITEIPSEQFLERLDRAFGIKSPRQHGHNAVRAVQAMVNGTAKAFIGLGGNLAVAMSDPQASFPAFRKLDLSVQICTKLNRTCLLTARESLILPCLGRTERDVQAEGIQFITVEDSMSMVHASTGRLNPASDLLKSEPAIIAGLAKATLPDTKVDWDSLIANYDRIRDKIEEVFPDFFEFNTRVREPGGFRLRVGASTREWGTPDGKAHFLVMNTMDEDDGRDDTPLTLMTVRSHDQYNTTIYGFNDRYRGISGRRDVLFANEEDMRELGFKQGDVVDVVAGDRVLPRLTLVAHAISRGSLAAYYPEANCLVALDDVDKESYIPAYKSIPVKLRPAAAVN